MIVRSRRGVEKFEDQWDKENPCDYQPPLIKHLDNEKSGSHRGWRINPPSGAEARHADLTLITMDLVSNIKRHFMSAPPRNKYLNDMESKSIFASYDRKRA